MIRRWAARLLAVAACCGGVMGATGAAAHAAAPAPATAPSLPVTGAVLYAPATGQFLYADNANRRLAIASTTKLMTALVTLQHVHHLSTVFAQNDWYPAADDSQIGLVPGERMSVHDLLLAMMLPSADDAAEDLAANVGGSVARFVAMMNAEAKALNLRNTHYTTPSGLDTPGNYSSAADLARLAQYDLAHSRFFARIVALPAATIRQGAALVRITNRNDLVGRYPWIDGVKTGHTDDAGYVLVAAGHRDGMSLISVVLGTPSEQQRDASTLSLLDYGFSRFAPRTPLHEDQVMAAPAVRDRPGVRAPLVAARGYSRILPRGEAVTLRVSAPRQVAAPMPAGAVVGSVSVLAGGQVLTRVPLVLTHRLVPVSGLTLAGRFVTKPLMLALWAVLAVLAGTGTALRRGARRKQRRARRQRAELEAA